MRRLQTNNIPETERSLISQQLWGLAIHAATHRLNFHLAERKRIPIDKWRARVHEVPGAAKWLRREDPALFAIKSSEGQILTSRSLAVEALRSFWATTFGSDHDAINPSDYMRRYENFLHFPNPSPAKTPLAADRISKSLKKMFQKATGFDGISARLLINLPGPFPRAFGSVLNLCEEIGSWPQALVRWRVVCIPKTKDHTICSTSETRPLSIAPVIYRIWASIRIKEMAAWAASFLHPLQAGGVGGQDAEALALCADFLQDPDTYPVGLDYRKAFDSLDCSIPLGAQ